MLSDRAKAYQQYVREYKARYAMHTFSIIPQSGDADTGSAAVRVQAPQRLEHLLNVVTLPFIAHAFIQDARTGEHAHGAYFGVPGVVVVRRIDEPTLQATIDDLIDFLSLDTYDAQQVISLWDPAINASAHATVDREQHPPCPGADLADAYVMGSDGKQYSATLISFRRLVWLFRKNAETGECAGGAYSCMRDMVVVNGRITEEKTKRIIDSMVADQALHRFFFVPLGG